MRFIKIKLPALINPTFLYWASLWGLPPSVSSNIYLLCKGGQGRKLVPQSANSQIGGLTNFVLPPAKVAICGFAICGPNIVCDLRISDLRT
jgi:hypothetical protein